MLENHCTQTAQSSRGGCSRRVHKIVYLAVNKGNILVNFFIFIAEYYHLYIHVCGFSDSCYSASALPKM